MKYHNQGNLQKKKKFLWAYSARGLKSTACNEGSKNWGLTSPTTSRKERESTGMVLGIKTSKSSPRPHLPYPLNGATNWGLCIQTSESGEGIQTTTKNYFILYAVLMEEADKYQGFHSCTQ